MKQKIMVHEFCELTLEVKGPALSSPDIEYIRHLEGPIYWNDREFVHFMFDQKLPSGRWLENIFPANDFRTAVAQVF